MLNPPLSNRYIFCVIAAFFFAHVLTIFLPSVNWEYIFVEAARYFETKDLFFVHQYFQYQANTLGLPFLAWLTSGITYHLDLLLVIRLLSACGVILLGIGINNFSNFLKRSDTVSILALVFLNPLVWIYSSRATADFLPAATGIFAISLVLGNSKSMARILSAGVLLGIAAILKYHAIFLLVILVPCLWDPQKKAFDLKTFFVVAAISSTLMGAYIFIAHKTFGFWITPPAFQSLHALNSQDLINNFFLYLGFLVLLCAPLSLVFRDWRYIFTAHWRFIIPGVLIIFFCGYFGFRDGGELNIGPLDRFIDKSVLAGLFLILSSCFFISLFTKTGDSSKEKFPKILLVAIGLVILIFSFTRPAQRYLLIVLPFFILLIPQVVVSNKMIFRTSIAIYLAVNFFVGYSQWCTGTAAVNITENIRQAGLLEVTDPGAIVGHVGNQFYGGSRGENLYIVVQGDAPDAIVKAQSGISFAKKSFSLVKFNHNSPILVPSEN